MTKPRNRFLRFPGLIASLLLLAVLTVPPPAAASAPQVTAIAGGTSSGYALKSDGTVWAWGDNYDGELGNPGLAAVLYKDVPVQVYGLTGVTAIAATGYAGYALMPDGTVRAWGSNYSGELGNGGGSTDSTVPVEVSGLRNVTAIAGGGQTGYALERDGTVRAWGDNYYGELGDGGTADSSVPVKVSGLQNVTAIAGGGYAGYALESDGTVWAWGYNYYGELGNGGTAGSRVPVEVSGLRNVTAIAANRYSAYALERDGTVWAWGYNYYGELGDGGTADSSVPVQVHGLQNVTAVAGGGYSGYVLKQDGTVWAWGKNRDGQLGDASNYDSRVPVQVDGLKGVKAIAAGGHSGYALDGNGTVWAWGHNYDGQLGDQSLADMSVPVQVDGLAAGAVLTDIAGNWARSDIEKLVALGAVTGYPGGTFHPDADITRAEFVTVLVKAFQLPPKPGPVFTDTAHNWAKHFISTAAAYGIVKGYNGGLFRPDAPVTREQMAVMIVRAAKLTPVAGDLAFTDSESIDSWAARDIVTAVADGIIKGFPDGTFKPDAYATRAEAAAAVVRALDRPAGPVGP
ncbi:MAG: S-layer homology domain-containing protein [Peptococcaceae bacterium]|nr:S-layer homology domain-containing protein [Peptococcaceae bacterium]